MERSGNYNYRLNLSFWLVQVIFNSNAIDFVLNMGVHNLAVLASYGRVKEKSVHFRVNCCTLLNPPSLAMYYASTT